MLLRFLAQRVPLEDCNGATLTPDLPSVLQLGYCILGHCCYARTMSRAFLLKSHANRYLVSAIKPLAGRKPFFDACRGGTATVVSA
jgi:hypothetical protein